MGRTGQWRDGHVDVGYLDLGYVDRDIRHDGFEDDRFA
jgi:hypothetical protein